MDSKDEGSCDLEEKDSAFFPFNHFGTGVYLGPRLRHNGTNALAIWTDDESRHQKGHSNQDRTADGFILLH